MATRNPWQLLRDSRTAIRLGSIGDRLLGMSPRPPMPIRCAIYTRQSADTTADLSSCNASDFITMPSKQTVTLPIGFGHVQRLKH